MSRSSGTKLGPYEIQEPLGAGGMGEVYRARDTRLQRTVAIKILPEHLSSDPGHRARFEREARAISRLSHPNICALFDIGDQDGIHYVVLEYLEGETLADCLARRALPVSEVLKVGVDIASALEAAHRNVSESNDNGQILQAGLDGSKYISDVSPDGNSILYQYDAEGGNGIEVYGQSLIEGKPFLAAVTILDGAATARSFFIEPTTGTLFLLPW
jgi:serine/threonine protein kinase